jgi:MFS transporter, OFA family, oxalate/formate antiporter
LAPDHDTAPTSPPHPHVRWVQLALGVLGMIAVANFQYGWTFFVGPIQNRFGWEKESIQWAFTFFVFTETWLVPLEGYAAERWGPRRMMVLGGVLVSLAWGLNAVADSLTLFYLAAIVGGTGAGMVYGTSIGSALKWFPDRRGMAAGLTAAGFGAGSALTVIPVRWTIENFGYQYAFLWFGLGQGLIVLLAGLFLRFPRPGETPTPPPATAQRLGTSGRDFTPWQMLRTPLFWLMYLMMTLVTLGGVTLIQRIDPISEEIGVKKVPLSIGLFTLQALSLAAMLERISSGITRPICGWVSDRIGRELTMFGAFTLQGIALLLLIRHAHDPVLFVIFTGLTFFFWGEIYSLFPALVGDTFGRRCAATNYGLMYTAKGTATLLIPLGDVLNGWTGSWTTIFQVAVVFSWITALLALFVLRPLRRRFAADTIPR